MSNIVDRFLEAQSRLVIQASDLSLESIASMVEGEAIQISPKYQRRERWTSNKQSALIESFLLNIPVPPIYLAEDEYGKYSVIDGKQRITAITNFIKKGQKLVELEKYHELEGFDFESLPDTLQNALRIRPYLRVITLLKQSDPDLKYEVFTRLNTGGEKLLAQEIRNVAFMGPYNDLIFELSENDFLRRQLKIKNNESKNYKEMVDAEYVLRFFTLREQWANFPGNMRYAMDEHMKKHRSPKVNEISNQRRRFDKSMHYAELIWGNDAFKRPELGIYRNQILQGIFDIQTVSISLLSNTLKNNIGPRKAKIKREFVKFFFSDESFQDSVRQFTSNTDRVFHRISEMTTFLKRILS